MGDSVRIWYKRKVRLDLLTFRQREMVEIGSAGLLDLKRRLRMAQGPTDAAAKPLKRGYAIWKTKQHKGNRRDLWLTGKMLNNLTLRTVSDNSARAGLTSQAERIKGWANMRRELWLVFSPANIKATAAAARRVFARVTNALVKQA